MPKIRLFCPAGGARYNAINYSASGLEDRNKPEKKYRNVEIEM